MKTKDIILPCLNCMDKDDCGFEENNIKAEEKRFRYVFCGLTDEERALYVCTRTNCEAFKFCEKIKGEGICDDAFVDEDYVEKRPKRKRSGR